MNVLALPGLSGRNPLGFLAALGLLDVIARVDSPVPPALRWTRGLASHAVIHTSAGVKELVAAVDRDRQRWLASPLLTWGPEGTPLSDLKPDPESLRAWALEIVASADGRSVSDLFCALVAEGAVAGSGDAKPTHLHFTAGQQRFLDMVRHIGNAIGPRDIEGALLGPWRFATELPTLGWHAGGERTYALRATDPSRGQRPGVPGADWLAFLGLTFLPVAAAGTALRTTSCAESWKQGWFRWPLWEVPLRRATVRSLLLDPTLAAASAADRAARGVIELLESPIRRTAQGGYGSFGPATGIAGSSATT